MFIRGVVEHTPPPLSRGESLNPAPLQFVTFEIIRTIRVNQNS
jgi:hypothetical protein